MPDATPACSRNVCARRTYPEKQDWDRRYGVPGPVAQCSIVCDLCEGDGGSFDWGADPPVRMDHPCPLCGGFGTWVAGESWCADEGPSDCHEGPTFTVHVEFWVERSDGTIAWCICPDRSRSWWPDHGLPIGWCGIPRRCRHADYDPLRVAANLAASEIRDLHVIGHEIPLPDAEEGADIEAPDENSQDGPIARVLVVVQWTDALDSDEGRLFLRRHGAEVFDSTWRPAVDLLLELGNPDVMAYMEAHARMAAQRETARASA